jgi:hypothetical protein
MEEQPSVYEAGSITTSITRSKKTAFERGRGDVSSVLAARESLSQ